MFDTNYKVSHLVICELRHHICKALYEDELFRSKRVKVVSGIYKIYYVLVLRDHALLATLQNGSETLHELFFGLHFLTSICHAFHISL
jgi:hypothetical protein